MAELADYKFKANYWPPPDDRKNSDSYLFGFDEDNQPYVVRWEKQRGYEGWIAATLSDNRSSGASAVPRHFVDNTVTKLIQYWSDAPCLMRTVFKAKLEKKKEHHE